MLRNTMNTLSNVAHGTVDIICDDLKKNTLTNIVTIGSGFGAGVLSANQAAKTGFTMLERNVATKTLVGGMKGGVKAEALHVGCMGSTPLGKVSKLTDKVAGLEKWFDNTPIGSRIDNEISYVQGVTHRAINRTFGM